MIMSIITSIFKSESRKHAYLPSILIFGLRNLTNMAIRTFLQTITILVSIRQRTENRSGSSKGMGAGARGESTLDLSTGHIRIRLNQD